MRELEIREDDFECARELHVRLALELRFPGHYGMNLSALSDCLGDVSETTRMTFVPEADGSDWFRRFVTVCERAAAENPSVTVEVRRGA